jgi:protein-S-isoprenylcysteine O-methyltransferase Ste14
MLPCRAPALHVRAGGEMLGCVPVLKTLLFTMLVPGTFVVLVPRWLLGGSWPAQGGLLGAAGALLLLCGAALYLRCAWEFATRGRGTPAPIDPPKQLVVTALYRHVRNPMYMGVLSMVLGQAALFRSPLLLLYAGAIFLAFHVFVVAYEEPALRSRFGESHERYCASVPRWLPRLRPWSG